MMELFKMLIKSCTLKLLQCTIDRFVVTGTVCKQNIINSISQNFDKNIFSIYILLIEHSLILF